MDKYLRDRSIDAGAVPINGLVTEIELPTSAKDKYVIKYSNYAGDNKVGTPETLEVDIVIGADGANSRVAASRQTATPLRESACNVRRCTPRQGAP